MESLDVYAPFDEELNPQDQDGRLTSDDCWVEDDTSERRTVKIVPREKSPQKRKSRWDSAEVTPKRKSRWDCPDHISKRKSRWDSANPKVTLTGVNTNNLFDFAKPQHWRDIQGVAGRPGMGETSGRTLVQKILFADAYCGTSTPNTTLDSLLQL